MAKPKIDLENPIVKIAFEILEKQTKIALETPQDVEKAVIPIYAIPKAKAHQKPKTKAEQFGSGVLIKIKNQYFILSSTHLFESFEGFVLQTGIGDGSLIEQISGERFSSGKIETPYSNYLDATVFHIQSDISENLKNLAISLEDLEFNDDDKKVQPIYLTSGFRNKKSNTEGNQVYSKREAYSSLEVDNETYEIYNIDHIPQFVTAYEDDILVDGRWQKSPIPRGFSGGAVIKIEGTNIRNPLSKIKKTKQKLKAIITEQHREKNNKPEIFK
ncbi:hypothetical protein [Flavobacterium aquicola]|uniref:Trypsin-like peptidase n=1 Tax=Flavobacterium aquicola TaxID=1682742 RepID=A0A3E0DVU4_9FLAO|nr:hypothetical protein [Flavobacterium aquicola]REG88752.1 hypothetical protein C8P67_1315 [Flavobacterium aquicola]